MKSIHEHRNNEACKHFNSTQAKTIEFPHLWLGHVADFFFFFKLKLIIRNTEATTAHNVWCTQWTNERKQILNYFYRVWFEWWMLNEISVWMDCVCSIQFVGHLNNEYNSLCHIRYAHKIISIYINTKPHTSILFDVNWWPPINSIVPFYDSILVLLSISFCVLLWWVVRQVQGTEKKKWQIWSK